MEIWGLAVCRVADGGGLVGGKTGTPQGPILIYEEEAPDFGVSHSLETGRGLRGGGGPEERGGASLLTDVPDTQKTLTEIYDLQIYGGKQKESGGKKKQEKRE